MPRFAYLLTFSTYGTHLPDSEKGWVDAQHAVPGSRLLDGNAKRQAWWSVHLQETPWMLDSKARQIVLEALRSVCAHRRWICHAVRIRTTHVHAIITGETAPERMLSNFKAYATRAIRHAFPGIQRRRHWAHHGSTRYLWNEVSFRAAIDYVMNGQGERMACYSELEAAERDAN